MKHLLLTLPVEAYPASDRFWQRLARPDGQTLEGTTVVPVDAPDHDVAGKKLRITVQAGRDSGALPGRRGLDPAPLGRAPAPAPRPSAPGRHPGGGRALPGALGVQAIVPADAHTAEILPEAATNVWTLRFSPDGRTLDYYLEPRFEARFDLERP
ncbi:MAG: hypothetical protein AB1758_32640 [Candidatus Eremiobacterota bacterium]